MKRLWLITLIICALGLPACSWIFPNASKAQTEKEQLEEMRKQTALLETQNEALSKLANSTTDIAESLSRINALANGSGGLCGQRP